MSNCPSTHGGARPGAGRKPKNAHQSVSELLSALLNDSEALSQTQTRLREQLPQLLEALMSLAQGATTTRERWVAAGTLTTGLGNDTRLLLPQLPPAQLVLVGIETYTHKPDSKALLFLLEHVLGNVALTSQPQTTTETTPDVEPQSTTPSELGDANLSEFSDDEYTDRSLEWIDLPDELTFAPDGLTPTLRQYPLPPRARPLTTKQSPALCHLNCEAIPPMPPKWPEASPYPPPHSCGKFQKISSTVSTFPFFLKTPLKTIKFSSFEGTNINARSTSSISHAGGKLTVGRTARADEP